MRSIKFRAWDKEFKKMVSVMSLTMPEQTPFILVREYGNKMSEARPREMLEIMQFTGLLDRNRTEIYEGDVYKFLGRNDVIKWNTDMTGFNFLSIDSNKVEVIGNIHQNTELL